MADANKKYVTKQEIAISTNIVSDAASDTKSASPKAVKEYVDGICGNIDACLASRSALTFEAIESGEILWKTSNDSNTGISKTYASS